RKAKRKRITQRQFEVLQGAFLVRDTPSHEVRAALAAQLDMSPREVQVWFQNRRAKYNRERALKKQKESQVN
ncbi:homeobox, partial [Linderina pennispora]